MRRRRLVTRHEKLTINNMTGLVAEFIAALNAVWARFLVHHSAVIVGRCRLTARRKKLNLNQINGPVAEYSFATAVTRVRFPVDA